MHADIGRLGTANLMKHKNDGIAARFDGEEGWMQHAKGLLKILALGLMLACGTAYASEPASPAPVAMTQNKVNHTQPTPNLASRDVGDTITDWTIGIFIIMIVAFFSINFLDSRKK